MRPGMGMLPPLVKPAKSAGTGIFTFLNRTQYFADGEIDWSCKNKGKLWRYNLHYFDYLLFPGRSWEQCSRLINDWIVCNPTGSADAWEPYPVSLRVVNWIKIFLRPESLGKIKQDWLASLYRQLHWLERNVEYHLLANHYFKNGKALLFGGLYFTGVDAERWMKKGLQILSSEIDEQVLPDGGHFERSPMYHAMILEDCLDLLNLCQTSMNPQVRDITECLRSAVRRMAFFLAGMTHPYGEIALFNDAAMGIEGKPSDLEVYYERVTGLKAPAPGGSCWAFPQTGYFVMAPSEGNRLFIDCGPVGPDYQLGHSHCDTLSFELSLKGRSVVVDSGCMQYEDGEIRRYNRGNAGHNTLTINGENQSEVWGAHRCARRAYPLYAKLEERPDGSLVFSGAHDGYRRLPGSPVHHRRIKWKGRECLVEDRVEGVGRHDVEVRLHIQPDFSADCDERHAVIRDGNEILLKVSLRGDGRLRITNGWYCPEFGIKRKCSVITARIEKVSLPCACGWLLETAQ
jgi:uncharacterized heparinase superfamily protein